MTDTLWKVHNIIKIQKTAK